MSIQAYVDKVKEEERKEMAIAAASLCYMLIYFRYTFKTVSISDRSGVYVSDVRYNPALDTDDPKILAQKIAESAIIGHAEKIGEILYGVDLQKDETRGYMDEDFYYDISDRLSDMGMDEKGLKDFISAMEKQAMQILKAGFKDVELLAERLLKSGSLPFVMSYADVRKVLAHISLTTDEALEYIKGNLNYIIKK